MVDFLVNLVAGRKALWISFWLVGVPLLFAWDLSLGCTFAECTRPSPVWEGLVLAAGLLTTLAVPFAGLAIWRSAARYRGPLAWRVGARAFGLMLAVAGCLVLSVGAYGGLHWLLVNEL